MGSSPTQRFKINLQYALNAADEYVWIYGEQYRWWPTRNPSVKPQNWETALPGIQEALISAVQPESSAQQKIAELQKDGKMANLLQNADFSSPKTNATPLKNSPADWKAIGAPIHWGYWQSGKSHGTFAQDDSVNHNSTKGGSARIAGVNSGCFLQSIEVKPGDSYYVSAWSRQIGDGIKWIRVGWQTAEGKWTDEGSSVLFSDNNEANNNGWREITGVVNVPPNAGKLIVLLNAGNQTTARDVIWYDDVQLYKLQ